LHAALRKPTSISVLWPHVITVTGKTPDAGPDSRTLVAAQQGHAASQFKLALHFLNVSVPDDQEAVKWLCAAAWQGHVEAICQLGTMLRLGRGVERNVPSAAEFHVIAAMAGNADALASLREYLPEIETCALNGSALAALCVAKVYDKGLSLEPSREHAMAWLRWGLSDCGEHAGRDEVVEDLTDMETFFSMFLDRGASARVDALLQKMRKTRQHRSAARCHAMPNIGRPAS
jgi:TPR repeat protein